MRFWRGWTCKAGHRVRGRRRFPPGAAALLLAAASCAHTGEDARGAAAQAMEAGAPARACTISARDVDWLERAVGAWHFTSRSITGIGAVETLQAVFFDDDCRMASADAMAGGTGEDAVYVAAAHGGTVALPDGAKIPAGVVSFTNAGDDAVYFVMALPSVWRAGGVDGGPLGLDRLMTAVLLHEATHVVQAATYGARMTALSERHGLPEDFSDDSIQERFEADGAFAASVEREIELLLAAADAPEGDGARAKARAALSLMSGRRNRWFTGADAHLAEAEDLWLTLEGSGQWAGYRWLVHTEGGGASAAAAMAGFGRRGRYWTQKQGLALALVADRLAPGWRTHVFGRGDLTIVDILERALETSP